MKPNIIARLITEDITINNGNNNLLSEWNSINKKTMTIIEDINKKILDEIDNGNYITRNEIWSLSNDKPTKITACYGKKDNGYIGEIEEAKFLCDKIGIIPEKSDSNHSVCSIGFCPKDGKWYGWSHRAIHGFKIGDHKLTLSPDGSESGGVINNNVEAKEAAIKFADSVS
jgi:hypothetical protein